MFALLVPHVQFESTWQLVRLVQQGAGQRCGGTETCKSQPSLCKCRMLRACCCSSARPGCPGCGCSCCHLLAWEPDQRVTSVPPLICATWPGHFSPGLSPHPSVAGVPCGTEFSPVFCYDLLYLEIVLGAVKAAPRILRSRWGEDRMLQAILEGCEGFQCRTPSLADWRASHSASVWPHA